MRNPDFSAHNTYYVPFNCYPLNTKAYVYSFSFVASKRERINEEREKTLYHSNAFGIATGADAPHVVPFCPYGQNLLANLNNGSPKMFDAIIVCDTNSRRNLFERTASYSACMWSNTDD